MARLSVPQPLFCGELPYAGPSPYLRGFADARSAALAVVAKMAAAETDMLRKAALEDAGWCIVGEVK